MFNGLRPPPSEVPIWARRWRVVALFGVLASLLLTALLSQHFAAAAEDYLLIEARVAAQRHDDGRVEVLLEVRRGSRRVGRADQARSTASSRIPPRSASGGTQLRP